MSSVLAFYAFFVVGSSGSKNISLVDGNALNAAHWLPALGV